MQLDRRSLDQAAAACLGDDGWDADLGRGRTGRAGYRAVGSWLLPDDVAESVADSQLAGPAFHGSGVIERERLKRLDQVAAVHVDQGIGASDELRERRMRQPIGQGARRVARKAPVQI